MLATVTEGATRNILVVATAEDELTWKSLRNVPFVHLLAQDQLNTYDVLDSDYVVFTAQASEGVRSERAASGHCASANADSGASEVAK